MTSLNVHPSSKTDQILSRYRPIAPKPPLEGPPTPENIQQSPFSKTHQYLLARPSRNRKRIKNGCLPASTVKKLKSSHPAFSPAGVASLAQNTQLALSLQGFAHGFPQQIQLSEKPLTLVTLPFLPYPSSSSVPEVARSVAVPGGNMFSQFRRSETPQEMDLLQNLHATDSAARKPSKGIVISPRAMRPVGSSISVECIQEDLHWNPQKCVSKKPEEVEAEIELDTLPAVVTGSGNRVRLANSAYMEMVGQPECLWLDSMTNTGHSCKRIGGKVILDLSESGMPISSEGFTCRVRIEWGSNAARSSINAHCDVVKLSCESKDYLFTWRFHTRETK